MAKKIVITYASDIESKKTPGKILRKAGEKVETTGDMTQGYIAALMYKPGSDTQTSNPAIEFAAGDVRQTRSFLRACLGLMQAGNPDDTFELVIDGVVYRRATRANLGKLFKLYEKMNELKRDAYPLVEQVAPLPTIGKKVKTESDDDDADDDEQVF